MPARTSDHVVLGVLPENVQAVLVWQECQASVVAGFGTASWLGISAGELRDAMWTCGVKRRDRDDIRNRIRVMEAAVRRDTAERTRAEQDKQEAKRRSAA